MSRASSPGLAEAEAVLTRWDDTPGPVAPAPDEGLINRTFLVGSPPSAVLQWVSPIFAPESQFDIRAVTEHLSAAGVRTPRLLPARGNQLWVAGDGGIWRLLTFIAGTTLHRIRSLPQAAEAGALVGQFHAALDDFPLTGFRAGPRLVHRTSERMTALRLALSGASNHPVGDDARRLAGSIADAWAEWTGGLDFRLRPCHGDLKISNLRFDADGRRALCLVDLDTLGPMSLPEEMGDAWRSWCNPAGEDEPSEAGFDRGIFRASVEAWVENAPPLAAEEQRALVPTIERIALELSARFCTDALRNSYFQEDRARFPEPGRHNLRRAAGQLNVAASVRSQATEAEAILRKAFSGR